MRSGNGGVRIWAILFAVSGLAVIGAGCDLPGVAEFRADREPAPEEEDFRLRGDPAAGQAFYQAQCTSCHGVEGRGDGPAAVGMDPPATDFTQVELSPERTYRVIRDGGRALGMSRAMPAFRAATDDQTLRDVAAYTLELSRQEPDSEPRSSTD